MTGLQAAVARRAAVVERQFAIDDVRQQVGAPLREAADRVGHDLLVRLEVAIAFVVAPLEDMGVVEDQFFVVEKVHNIGRGRSGQQKRRPHDYGGGHGFIKGYLLFDKKRIDEVERLRLTSAHYIVIGWPAFWWLDYYSALREHLQSKYPCVLSNSRLMIYDLC